MNKNLASMTVLGLVVYLQLRQEVREADGDTFLCIGAQCGLTQGDTSISMHPSANHTTETLDRDIAASAQRIAEETAARERARLLLEELFK